MMSETATTKVYHGNCHCGNFKYKITAPELSSAINCDCSICTRRGYLFFFPPTDGIEIIKDGPLTSYNFANNKLTHKFCATCGNGVMACADAPHTPGGPTKGFNARLIDPADLDITKLKGMPYKGSGTEPIYAPHSHEDEELQKKLKEGEKIYTGSCHCGAVKIAVKSKPLTESQVVSCNCSVCGRGGEINIYPSTNDISLSGESNLNSYTWEGIPHLAHKFCKTCGVSVMTRIVVPPEELTKNYTPEKLEEIKKDSVDGMALNVRILNDVDLDELKIYKYDGLKNPPFYECA